MAPSVTIFLSWLGGFLFFTKKWQQRSLDNLFGGAILHVIVCKNNNKDEAQVVGDGLSYAPNYSLISSMSIWSVSEVWGGAALVSPFQMKYYALDRGVSESSSWQHFPSVARLSRVKLRLSEGVSQIRTGMLFRLKYLVVEYATCVS